MSKLAKALLIAGVIYLALAAMGGITVLGLRHLINLGPVFTQISESVSRTETDSRTASGLDRIELVTRNGKVTVTNGETDEINVIARLEVRAGSQSAAQSRLAQLSTVTTTRDGVLRIEAVFPSQNISNESISFEVQMPHNLDLVVRTSNGSITALNLGGKLNLETSNGTIEVTSSRGPEEIRARTSNGRIIVSTVPEGGMYDLRTSNGAINITLPETAGVEVDLSTSNGTITLGSGQWLLQGGQISSRNAAATRGDGSLKLKAVTSNGNIVIAAP